MINSKLPDTPTSIFSIMSTMAADHKAINLSQGFPNFDSDPRLIDLVAEAMRNGYNQYAPMPGLLELRRVISNKVFDLYGRSYDPEQEITMTAGATQAIFAVFTSILNKGDEVILFTPAYDCYEPTVKLFGAIPVPVQLQAPAFTPDWKLVSEKISPKTKMIVINSPHNPTGMTFKDEDMTQLEKLVEDHDLLVLSDEVYEHIIFDGQQHNSAAKYSKLANRTFITASFGKTFHNTGWKMGYCLAPKELMTEFRKVHQFNVFCVNHPIQKALVTYLKNADTYLGLSSFYQEKRDRFLSLIKDSRFIFTPAEGTYFQMLDYSNISSESDLIFTEKLTKENGLATIPISVFNTNKEDHKLIRVCFAKTDETLSKAAKILCSI